MSQKTLLSFFEARPSKQAVNCSSPSSPVDPETQQTKQVAQKTNESCTKQTSLLEQKPTPENSTIEHSDSDNDAAERSSSPLTNGSFDYHSVGGKRHKRVIESDDDEDQEQTSPLTKQLVKDDDDNVNDEPVGQKTSSINSTGTEEKEDVKNGCEEERPEKRLKLDSSGATIKTLSQLGRSKTSRSGARKRVQNKRISDEKRTEVAEKESESVLATESVSAPTGDEAKPNKETEDEKKVSSNSLLSKTDFLVYDPCKENYNPITDACWKRGESVPYLALAKTFLAIEETRSRLKIINILSNYFRSVLVLSQEDLTPSIYLCLNKLGPAYDGQELGIADTYLIKAIIQCTGRSMSQIKADIKEVGDLGIVAERSRSNQKVMFRPSALTVRTVFSQLSDIASISGHSAIGKKIDKIQALFVKCRDCETRFMVRSLAGKLRIGLAEQSVIQALALACTTTPPNQDYPPSILDAARGISASEFKAKADENALILKTVYCECPNYNRIVPALLEKGVKALPECCRITPGVPVKPMLAKPTKGIQEVLQRFEGIEFTCEWKYDGERAQIHILEGGAIKIFSRNMEDNTTKYPDVVSDFGRAIKENVTSCILDAEAVAWDTEHQKIMPFQVLSTRKRKGVNVDEIKVRVCVFLFDLLYLNGESLIQKSFSDRRDLLKYHFAEVEHKFSFVKCLDTNTMEEVQEFLDESVKGNCEGLMIKTLNTDATYEIARRSCNWLKLKKDYLDGFGDTLDLVVIGGYIGKGKRTGQYGGFLLASYDSQNEEYQTICKIGTGFTDDDLISHANFFKNHVIPAPKSYYRYDASHPPDHWFDAVQVWEVKCADLSLSPVYYSAIGLVDPEKGISLRFPRFLKIRDDKSVEEATSSQQVAELYQNQEQVTKEDVDSKFDEEYF